MIGRSIACFLGPLQHAYWQKWTAVGSLHEVSAACARREGEGGS
jgi:hypothetical protein